MEWAAEPDVVRIRSNPVATIDGVSVDNPAQLVVAAAGGDDAAWEALVDRFANLVWSVARSFRLDDASAHDVFQETWARLARSLDSIREPDRVSAWLVTTAKREAIRVSQLESRNVSVGLDVEPSAAAGADPTADRVIRLDDADRLHAALTACSPRCQMLLRLLFFDDDLSYAEIAEILDMPIGSLGPTRQRCLTHIRTMLEEVHDES